MNIYNIEFDLTCGNNPPTHMSVVLKTGRQILTENDFHSYMCYLVKIFGELWPEMDFFDSKGQKISYNLTTPGREQLLLG